MVRLEIFYAPRLLFVVHPCVPVKARSADGARFSTVKGAPGRCPNPRSDDCFLYLSIDPDSHSVACGRTKRFFRVYCKFSLPPLVDFSRVEGDRVSSQGCGCGYIYKNTTWQRGFRQLQSMYVARLPKRPAFLHFFGTLRASKCSSSHHCHLSTLSIYHSRLGTDRQDEDEDQQIRYVINRLVQKLFRDYRHNRIQDYTEQKQKDGNK